MNRHFIPFSAIFLACFYFSRHDTIAQANYAQYVKPMTGTGEHGHTFPGAVLPFGMVQLSPDTRNDNSWDGCGGYHYNDSLIYGLSHTHLSGTGCTDYGDFLIMPMMGKASFNPKQYASKFSHRSEKASPGYYAVKLEKDDIDVELTTTIRVGFHKYTFNKAGKVSFVIDLKHRNILRSGGIQELVGNKRLYLWQIKEGWAKRRELNAIVEFSIPFDWNHDVKWNITGNKRVEGNDAGIAVMFSVKKGQTIFVKVALSSVDASGADSNLVQELPHWDFEKVKKDAEAAWNKELSKIEVKTNNLTDLQNFYTALYHCMIHPSINNDVDGRYRGNDLKIHKTDHDHYTVFSLWDTFRALHPLFTIIDQKRTTDFIKTFLDVYNESGMLPMWELAGNETYCMIGYHAASVIADALSKGIGGFDTLALFKGLYHSATMDKFGIKEYASKGYLSAEEEPESVSKTLEYAYDDECIRLIARMLERHPETHPFFAGALSAKRGRSWLNVFNPQNGFMQPRFNGGWLTSFDPREVNNHYTEANAWQYSFFVPHAIGWLAEMHGGKAKFEKKLDELFSADSRTTGRDQADITGLIGQYAHGNEPSHHVAYLYNYVSASHKTQKLVWRILHDMYRPAPDGLCGNEDCGQMSAWYVFSGMGFYPDCPGRPDYALGVCLFDTVKIHLVNGNTFSIFTSRNNPGDYYIKRLLVNGDSLDLPFLTHEKIMNGGKIEIVYSPLPPEKGYLSKPGEKLFNYPSFYPSSPILEGQMIFHDSTTISIHEPSCTGDTIYYSINHEKQMLYSKPFTLSRTSHVSATVVPYDVHVLPHGIITGQSEGTFYKMKHPDWKVSYNYQYNKQYSGGGAEALIDGIQGDENWKKGFWQGFQGQDLEIIIDMGKETKFELINVSVLQDTKSWILFPKKILFEVSSDGKHYKHTGEVKNTVPEDKMGIQKQNLHYTLLKPMNARYVKLVMQQYGKLPAWHPGKGGDSFIFVDEVEIK